MKFSKQRELILGYVKSVTSHPTADTVYSSLIKENPTLSLGTVYRNLDRLTKKGEIIRLKFPNEFDRYDGNTNHHYHGICSKCGNVIDIFIDYFADIDRLVEKNNNCKVLSHDVIFSTICPKCLRKNGEEL